MTKVAFEEMQQVSGGWNESQLTMEEMERFLAIRGQLDAAKEGWITLTTEEIDRLLNEMYQFEREMEEKYGR